MNILWINPFKYLIIILTMFFSVLFLYVAIKQTQSITPVHKAKRQTGINGVQKKNQWFPMRLKIPKIHVDAAVEYLGITNNGAMDVPSNTIDVGWFKLGSHPGEKGSAVIAGHFDGENGSAGVFTNLNKLKQGDKIYINYANGISFTFIVRESQSYSPGYAANVFSAGTGMHLNLITCGGMWDSTKKSYTRRLIVFADAAQ